VCLNKVPVPSQESEPSCVCVLIKYMYQAKKVSRHVCVSSWLGTGTLLRHTHKTAHFLGLVQVLRVCVLMKYLYQAKKVSRHVYVS
jgi:hypothetical protein